MANASDPKKPVSMEDVFAALKSERIYQKILWGYFKKEDGIPDFSEAQHGLCDWLVYMQHYLSKAMAAAATEAGNEPALEQLRKVVALGIVAFEQCGIEERDLRKPIKNRRDGKTYYPFQGTLTNMPGRSVGGPDETIVCGPGMTALEIEARMASRAWKRKKDKAKGK